MHRASGFNKQLVKSDDVRMIKRFEQIDLGVDELVQDDTVYHPILESFHGEALDKGQTIELSVSGLSKQIVSIIEIPEQLVRISSSPPSRSQAATELHPSSLDSPFRPSSV